MADLAPNAHVLVTGANGFVGSRVCQQLTNDGVDVTALVRRADADLSRAGDVTMAVAPLDDRDGLREAMTGITHVVHCAAAAGPDLKTATAANVTGTRAVLEAAVAAGAERLVHVSTTSVVDDGATTVDEDAPRVDDGASAYAVTKRDAEDVVAEVTDATGITAVVLRPPAVLGWAPTSTWGQRVPRWVADGELPFDPDRRGNLGWVHVDDFADAVAQALTAEAATGRTYTVAAGTTTWGEYLDEVMSWFPGCPDPFATTDTPPAARTWDASRIRDELGWTPEWSLDAAQAEAAAHHT